MKNIILSILALAVVAAFGCKEDPAKTWVTGDVTIAEKSWSWAEIEGTLDSSDGDYYGSCTKSGDDFEFEVGHANSANLTGNEFSVVVRGIVGPPEDHTFVSPGKTQDDPALYSEFTTAAVSIVGDTWSFDSSSDECNVVLFSKAGQDAEDKDEVEPLTNHDFEYYVHIECTGMFTEMSNNDTPLNTFVAEFYFDKC